MKKSLRREVRLVMLTLPDQRSNIPNRLCYHSFSPAKRSYIAVNNFIWWKKGLSAKLTTKYEYFMNTKEKNVTKTANISQSFPVVLLKGPTRMGVIFQFFYPLLTFWLLYHVGLFHSNSPAEEQNYLVISISSDHGGKTAFSLKCTFFGKMNNLLRKGSEVSSRDLSLGDFSLPNGIAQSHRSLV